MGVGSSKHGPPCIVIEAGKGRQVSFVKDTLTLMEASLADRACRASRCSRRPLGLCTQPEFAFVTRLKLEIEEEPVHDIEALLIGQQHQGVRH
jgi:hypothetical protein